MLQKQTILVVDDAPENLDVIKELLIPDYIVKAAINGKTAIKIATTLPPDLILLDIMMPEMDGYEVCRRLKADPDTSKIPVIFVTAMSESIDEQRGFSVGAIDYVTKPINPDTVRARVRTHLALSEQQRTCQAEVAKRTKELEESQRAAISMLGAAGHYNDNDTGNHIWRMAAYAARLAQAIHWPVEQTALLELAAPMHDTGKIGIPDAILKAPRKLSDEEMAIIKTHTTIGHSILSKNKTPLFKIAADIALNHHERWDGSGYPNALAGDKIPEAARITAICDVFDALTMKRAYKKAWPIEKAFETIQNESGAHFDPYLVESFLGIKEEIIKIQKKWATT